MKHVSTLSLVTALSLGTASHAAVISVDLERSGTWSGNSAVTATGDQGGTGDFATGTSSAWNSWDLGSQNSVGVNGPFTSGVLTTRDSSATANNVTLTLEAGPQTVNSDPKYRTLEISGGDAVHRDGLQIQHNNTSATFTFGGLIAGNTYSIRVHTMDRGGGAHVITSAGPVSSNIGTSSDAVFTGYVANASGEVSFVVTDNDAYRDETIGGIEIAGDFLVPEPSSMALLGLGGLLIARRRRG